MLFRPVSGSSTRVSWFPMAPQKTLIHQRRAQTHLTEDICSASPSLLPPVRTKQKTIRQRCLSSPRALLAVNQRLDNIPAHCQSVPVQLSLILNHFPQCRAAAAAGVCSVCFRQIVSMLWGGVASLHHISAPPPQAEAWKLQQTTPSSLFLSLQYSGMIKKTDYKEEKDLFVMNFSKLIDLLRGLHTFTKSCFCHKLLLVHPTGEFRLICFVLFPVGGIER